MEAINSSDYEDGYETPTYCPDCGNRSHHYEVPILNLEGGGIPGPMERVDHAHQLGCPRSTS